MTLQLTNFLDYFNEKRTLLKNRPAEKPLKALTDLHCFTNTNKRHL